MTDYELNAEGGHYEAKLSESLVARIKRSADTWQFFAFVFASFVALSLSLLDGLEAGWPRTVAKIVAFLLIGYATLRSRRGRNALVRLLPVFETEVYSMGQPHWRWIKYVLLAIVLSLITAGAVTIAYCHGERF